MTVVRDVVLICNSIFNSVSRILDVKEDWFFVPVEFRADLELIRSRINSCERLYSSQGQEPPEHLMKLLKKARVALLRVEARIDDLQESKNNDKCCSSGRRLYSKLYTRVFPDKLEKYMKRVNEELDKVPQIVKDEAYLRTVVQQEAKFQPIPTIVHNNDDLYVPIEDSQIAVLTAIENFDGPRIILLYGGVGKGKSTLGRYVCWLYGKHGNRKNLFDCVRFVECSGSSKLDSSNKQFEILNHLSPELSPTSADISPQKKRVNFKDRIAASLHRFFMSGKKILVILDDVSNSDLVSDMWKASEGGTQVKFLVTSQYSNLCSSFKRDSLSIAMGDPNREEALRILPALAGLEDKILPPNVKGIATKMINATNGNPLALACLASNLASNNTSVRLWQDTLEALRETLNQKETTIVLGHSRETPGRSLWAAMKICMDSLKREDAKNILFFIYACEGESVPEEILRILHAATKTSTGIFLNSIEELRSRELLKVSARSVATKMKLNGKDRADQQESRAWSLLTTVKLYMEQHMASDEKMEEKMSSLFRSLLGHRGQIHAESSGSHDRTTQIEAVEKEKTKVSVAIALSALYFDRDHSNKVVAEAANRACKASKIDWNATIKDRRRKAIEPLIWLMDQPEEDDLGWTESSVEQVRQIFLRYVCDRELDDKNICLLLNLTSYPLAQLTTLTTLAEIFAIEEAPVLKQDSLTFLRPLMHLLTSNEDVQPSIQEAASKALLWISQNAVKDVRKELCKSIVANTPHLLSILVDALEESFADPTRQSNTLARNAAGTLWNVSYGGGASIKLQILSEDGMLAALVKSLSKEDNPTLQQNAAGTLQSLASGEESAQLRILSEDGLVEGLAKSLSNDHNPELQQDAAWALQNLMANLPETTVVQISSKDGVLAALIRCLWKDDNPILQTTAAAALSNLAITGGESINLQIVNEQGALDGLVAALSKEKNPKLQRNAAMALTNLATGGRSTQLRLVNQDGALDGLVKSLSKEENPELQKYAAWALMNLVENLPEMNKLQISSKDGVLAALGRSLLRDDNPILQEKAAGFLTYLASGGESAKLLIWSEKGLFEGLVNSLSSDENPELQKFAAGAIKNLAAGEDTIKVRILNEDGALQGLVGALWKEHNPELQKEAAWALANLALGGDEIKLMIVNQNRALAGLVRALALDNHPFLQVSAATTLKRLGQTEDSSIKLRMRSEESLLEAVTKSVAKEENRDLQKETKQALKILSPD